MRTSSERGVLRRTLVRHTILTLLVAVVVSVVASVGVMIFARQEARRTAEQVARQTASAVLVPLSRHDFTGPTGPVRGQLLADVAPFLGSGMISRIKVWTGPAERARIAFSDEPRIEDETSRLDPDALRRIGAGQIVVGPVPHDEEHRFETPGDDALLEVFITFRDLRGIPSRLEVYVPVDPIGTADRTVAAVLPMVLGGIAILALATLPLSITSARRIERERVEQRAVRRYGLAAADSGREELARRLHDGVIPDLAGASLLLDAARAVQHDPDRARSRRLLDDAHFLLAGEVDELRSLLSDLVPVSPIEDLATALRELAERLRPDAGPDVSVEVSPQLDAPSTVTLVLHRIAGELLRNAFRHADAAHVQVTVTPADNRWCALAVSDDGVGFQPDARPSDGHIGLRLIGRTVDDHGGRMQVASAPGAGTTVTVAIPPPPGTAQPPRSHDPTVSGRR